MLLAFCAAHWSQHHFWWAFHLLASPWLITGSFGDWFTQLPFKYAFDLGRVLLRSTGRAGASLPNSRGKHLLAQF